MTVKGLPYYTVGEVVKGFGRGSKQLGIPTANFSENVVNHLPKTVGTGVYFGYASVDSGPVYDMVMSIGFNPFYKNEQKSMETHILNQFAEDFYGSSLRVCIVGFIRQMTPFKSLDELIVAINEDIKLGAEMCARPEHQVLRNSSFFMSSLGGASDGQVSAPRRL